MLKVLKTAVLIKFMKAQSDDFAYEIAYLNVKEDKIINYVTCTKQKRNNYKYDKNFLAVSLLIGNEKSTYFEITSN